MSWSGIVTIATGFALLYAFIAWLLMRIAEPLRAASIELGSDLLKDSTLPRPVRAGVEIALVELPGRWAAWRVACSVIPALLYVLSLKKTRIGYRHPALPAKNHPAFKKWDRFTDRVLIATLLNSPAATLVFIFFAVISLVVVTLYFLLALGIRKIGVAQVKVPPPGPKTAHVVADEIYMHVSTGDEWWRKTRQAA